MLWSWNSKQNNDIQIEMESFSKPIIAQMEELRQEKTQLEEVDFW